MCGTCGKRMIHHHTRQLPRLLTAESKDSPGTLANSWNLKARISHTTFFYDFCLSSISSPAPLIKTMGLLSCTEQML